MLATEIFQRLSSEFGEKVLGLFDQQPSDPAISIAPEAIFDICHTLRDDEEMQFDYLMSLSGLDLGEKLGMVYHLCSMQLGHRIVIKAEVDKANPIVPSVERLWRTADWHERETYDLVGIHFEGHHNMIRILCPYDWEGHPLRKDYQVPEMYHGMKVTY